MRRRRRKERVGIVKGLGEAVDTGARGHRRPGRGSEGDAVFRGFDRKIVEELRVATREATGLHDDTGHRLHAAEVEVEPGVNGVRVVGAPAAGAAILPAVVAVHDRAAVGVRVGRQDRQGPGIRAVVGLRVAAWFVGGGRRRRAGGALAERGPVARGIIRREARIGGGRGRGVAERGEAVFAEGIDAAARTRVDQGARGVDGVGHRPARRVVLDQEVRCGVRAVEHRTAGHAHRGIKQRLRRELGVGALQPGAGCIDAAATGIGGDFGHRDGRLRRVQDAAGREGERRGLLLGEHRTDGGKDRRRRDIVGVHGLDRRAIGNFGAGEQKDGAVLVGAEPGVAARLQQAGCCAVLGIQQVLEAPRELARSVCAEVEKGVEVVRARGRGVHADKRPPVLDAVKVPVIVGRRARIVAVFGPPAPRVVEARARGKRAQVDDDAVEHVRVALVLVHKVARVGLILAKGDVLGAVLLCTQQEAELGRGKALVEALVGEETHQKHAAVLLVHLAAQAVVDD